MGETERNSDQVRSQLHNVKAIQATEGAFAAIRDDGSVVTWGSAAHGADSSAVQGHLTDVKEIQASANSFAALTMQGSVVTWGPGVDDMGAKVKKRLAANGRIRAIQSN